MSILKTILERINSRIEVSNIFDSIYTLCEIKLNGDEKAWVHYIGNGQAEIVTNFDAKQGTLFWAKRGKTTITKIENLKVSGCKQIYQTTFPLTAYAVVKKSHLPCDSEDAADWIASRVFKLASGRDYGFKQVLGVLSYEVVPSGYNIDNKNLPKNYEWECVAIDFEIQIASDSEDGCYDICNTGDIPLPPDFLPCTPCLTFVSVDGVTITGDGTPENPLVGSGGSGDGLKVAIPFTTDHLATTGNGYVIGDIVWYNGNIYRCIANNDSLLPTNTTYWANLGVGYRLIAQPSDWNATAGNNQILNKPTIPAAQVNSDWNATSGLAEILNKPTIPAGGLPAGGTAGQILTKVDATDYNATWQENYADWTSVVKHIVKNDGASGTITKGTAVYVTGSNGTNMLVGRASNTSEATSSKTMGLMQSDITTTGGTQTGFVITEGLLSNLNTAGTTAGDPVWLGVNGALIYGLINKPYAPAHLVFIGIVTKVSAGNGEIFVKVQNGFELKEIHDVDLITTTPINGHVLGFDGTLWVNKTIATWLGFTPVTNARTLSINGTSFDLSADRSWTIPKIGIFKNTTDGAASSGTTNTFSQSVLVPANSVALGNVLEFKLRGRKTGALAVYTIRLYANTTNNLSGSPLLLATYTGTLTQALSMQMTRTAAVKNATTNTEMLLATTTNAPNDNVNTTFSAIAVDWTADKYIIGAVQNANATDSSLISLISMTII